MTRLSPAKTRLLAAGGTVAAAVVGTLGTDPQSAWYRKIRTPPWQPPAIAFPIAWTTLYALIGWGAGQAAVAQQDEAERKKFAGVFAADMAVNAAWCWTFFKAHRTGASVGVIAALDVLNVEMIRRARQADPRAAAALVPYGVWTAFATALSVDIWRRNR